MRIALAVIASLLFTSSTLASQKLYIGGRSAERIFTAITKTQPFVHLQGLSCESEDSSQHEIQCIDAKRKVVTIPWKIRVEPDFVKRIRDINCAYGFRRFDDVLEKEYTCEVTIK
jgi:hypothetical protein